MPTPIIFLAFANDQNTPGGYLRNLNHEKKLIRQALDKICDKQTGICELVVEDNASIDDIIRVFQEPAYQDRIAIFHFAGHANSSGIFLQNISGKIRGFNGSNLAEFLGGSKELKMVFLNGCSTEKTAHLLIQHGIPLVVGTIQEIADEKASELANRFYTGLGKGRNIETAWREAENVILGSIGNGENYDYRGLYLESVENAPQHFPWKLYFRPGSENIHSWNLPQEAQNPLFGLPEIPHQYYIKLPPAPFLSLQTFRREHAAIFFGRGAAIRELYNKIQGSFPILLYYGPSGVGKSSLLEAGIIPRLEATYEIISESRKATHPLAKTLLEALSENQEQENVAQVWLSKEAAQQRPVLFLFDQLEEVYTRPSMDISPEAEFAELCHMLSQIFDQATQRPQGKIILAYREEYHARIEKTLQSHNLPYISIFLQPLDKAGIIEAITGINGMEQTRDKYQLLIQENQPKELANQIADDLLADNQSTLAPVLQILLGKMWAYAKEQSNIPIFSASRYTQLKKEGYLLRDFLDQQMDKLHSWKEEVVDSGLALDVLYYFTTTLGTAESRTAEAVLQRYEHRNDVMGELLQRSVDLYLLQKSDKGVYRLSHDTLAPLVRAIHEESGLPGQLASRILANKLGVNEAILDEADLKLVVAGLTGRTDCNKIENDLIVRSQAEQANRKRIEHNRWRAVITSAVVAFALAIAAIFFWRDADIKRIQVTTNLLTSKAWEVAKIDFAHSIGLIKKAFELHKGTPPNNVMLALGGLFYQNPSHRYILKNEINFNSVFPIEGIDISDDEKKFLSWGFDGIKICNENNQINGVINEIFIPVGAKFSQNKQKIYSWDRRGVLAEWSQSGKLKNKIKNYTSIAGVQFNKNERLILFWSYDDTIRIWDTYTNNIKKISTKAIVENAIFSPDQKSILACFADNSVKILNIQSNKIITLSHNTSIVDAKYIKNGKQIICCTIDGDIHIYDENGSKLEEFSYATEPTGISISPDGENIVIWAQDSTIRVRNRNSHEEVRIPLKLPVLGAEINRDGRTILAWTNDDTIRIWNKQGEILEKIAHGGQVHGAHYSKDGRRVISWSNNGKVRVWNIYNLPMVNLNFSGINTGVNICKDEQTILFWGENIVNIINVNTAKKHKLINHKDEVIGALFDATGNRILTWSKDNTVNLWNREGKLIKSLKHKDVFKAQFSKDNNYIIACSEDTVKIWTLGGTLIFKVTHKNIRGAELSSDNNMILTWSFDDTRIWNKNGTIRKIIGSIENGVDGASFNKDEKYVLYWGGTALCLNEIEGTESLVWTHPLNPYINGAKFSKDENRIFSWYQDGSVEIWDRFSTKGQKMIPEMKNSVYGIELSRNERFLLCWSEDKTAKLWDFKQKTYITLVHESAVIEAKFNNDENLIISGASDGTVTIWDLKGNPIAKMKHKEFVKGFFISKNNQYVVSYSNGEAKLWPTPQSIYNYIKSNNLANIPESVVKKYLGQ